MVSDISTAEQEHVSMTAAVTTINPLQLFKLLSLHLLALYPATCSHFVAAFVRGEPESGDNDASWLLRFYETFKVASHKIVLELYSVLNKLFYFAMWHLLPPQPCDCANSNHL